MSALGDVIDGAVAAVIVEHPKLFNAQTKERARKTLVREIIKCLVREVREVEDETAPVVLPKSAGRLIGDNDSRARAYCNLRELAGAVRPQIHNGSQIFLPPEAETAAVGAFAELPPRSAWLFVSDRRQLTAWAEFFDNALADVPRRAMAQSRDGVMGEELPWPWPPSKTGKIYEAGSDEEIS